MNKGYLVVASKNIHYLTSTQLLADSLKEYSNYPITLITHDQWIDNPGNHVFDNIIGGAPFDIRAKLWGLTKTPYDLTCYLDADMVCLNKKADQIFDSIVDNDIVFSKIRPYCAAKMWWDIKNEYRPHGGVFVWNNNDRMKIFMQQWWDNWMWKKKNKWHSRWDNKYSKISVRGWDQFPLHLMMFDNQDPWYRGDIKWNWFFNTNGTDDAKWNFCSAYDYDYENLKKEDIVFYSYDKSKRMFP